MAIQSVVTDNREVNQLQSNFQSSMKPVANNPLMGGTLLSNVSLAIGDNTVNHKLNKTLSGWILTNISGASSVYKKSSDKTNLVLNSSAAVTVDIYVF